jgi:hypothetical protein
MWILILILLLILGLWIYGFNAANDQSVKTKKLSNIKKALVIFPHPDDEANSLGGTITKMVGMGINVDWVILTRGEKGNDDAHYDENLKPLFKKTILIIAWTLSKTG